MLGACITYRRMCIDWAVVHGSICKFIVVKYQLNSNHKSSQRTELLLGFYQFVTMQRHYVNAKLAFEKRPARGLKAWGGIFKLLRSTEIDSKESIQPAYEVQRTGTTTLFLAPIDCYKIPAKVSFYYLNTLCHPDKFGFCALNVLKFFSTKQNFWWNRLFRILYYVVIDKLSGQW
jgi:hypothetical protein